jgi:hypothetical protein
MSVDAIKHVKFMNSDGESVAFLNAMDLFGTEDLDVIEDTIRMGRDVRRVAAMLEESGIHETLTEIGKREAP